MSGLEARDGLYIHVPFCDGKCSYCAFYSVPYDGALAESWLGAVETERRLLTREGIQLAPDTIYIGGGTPSLLSLPQWERLLQGVGPWQGSEWTVEANPGSLDHDRVRMWMSHGVNRISLGVQSLNDGVLRALGRRHSVEDIRTAVAAIRSAGLTNWGLDLIACVPGVDRECWREVLKGAVELGPCHISVYALTSEEGSALARRVSAGHTVLLDEDEQLAMLAVAEEVLGGAGFIRYEISNYARPGCECRHNLSCWRGGNYVGLGCAASSRVGRRRWTNAADVGRYIQALAAGQSPPREVEELSAVTDALERLVFGLRMAEGVALDEVLRCTGLCESVAAREWGRTLGRLETEELVCRDGAWWCLTPRGREVADHVAVELVP